MGFQVLDQTDPPLDGIAREGVVQSAQAEHRQLEQARLLAGFQVQCQIAQGADLIEDSE